MSDYGEKIGENVTKSPEAIARAQKVLAEQGTRDNMQEAAAQAEAIVAWLQQDWGERGFTPEQCVFALALATINFRESVPEKFGGKEMFDRVASEARAYYNANK
jgi:hypothetical protein